MRVLEHLISVMCILNNNDSKTKIMSNIKLFKSKQIRSEWNEIEQKWYFAIVNVIEILT